MRRYVLDLKEIDKTPTDGAAIDGTPIAGTSIDGKLIDATLLARVGGKGAQLRELSRIEGINVPDGFCVTTDAFELALHNVPLLNGAFDALTRIPPSDADAIRTHCDHLHQTIQGLLIPHEVATTVREALSRYGEAGAYAVRSSATAEDLPTASFAGQHDTYLNVVGTAQILENIRRCWASLFTERAVIYRMRNGVDHRKVRMAVVVQRMVFPHAAGILFTADPVSGNRNISSIDASFGLGEALVFGSVNPDVYKVRNGEIVAKTIGTKKLAIQPSANSGTQQLKTDPAQQAQAALTDADILRLETLGHRIESHFGRPQDIEWCLANGDFLIVQSRPITTLFPIPEATDKENHVYLSVGHQQMMTDPIKPLGISFWQMETPRPMAEAGGRLFVDVTEMLSTHDAGTNLLDMMNKSDPLFRDAIQTVFDRKNFLRLLPNDKDSPLVKSASLPSGTPHALPPLEMDPAIVTSLIDKNEQSVAALKRNIQGKFGSELFEFILADIQELRRLLFDPNSNRVYMTAFASTWWLNEKLEEWLGEKKAADTLTQSVDNNVTSQMGLALLNVADVIRPHRDVVEFLEHAQQEDSSSQDVLDRLIHREGGPESKAALLGWLDKYGMRCVGEIDITRPRWSESLTTLLPLLLRNIKNAEPGAAKRRFEAGLRAAQLKEREILERVRSLPDGDRLEKDTKTHIDRVRTFIGYREYPKYGKTSRDFVYKRALMEEAERLVGAGVIREKEDIFFLRFQELHEVVRTGQVDNQLIRRRKAEFKAFQSLKPPRVLTSEGEGISGSYRRDDEPAGALVGLGVSAGTVEGRARVVVDITKADLEPGDILVTTYTDPSWTPLFVAIKGLVTEVGGLMTHGAVVAREYGLPAVVGVENATTRIRDGQQIRVDGTAGWVEILGG